MFFLTKTPYLLKKFYPKQLIWNKSRAEKVIYLTFDDGPIPIVTPWVIKTLKNFNAKATFFCIGDNITKHPEIFEQLKADGHAIGNHTFNHLKGWKTDDETYLANFLKCQQLTQTNLFRPPYGRIKKSQIERILGVEYQVASIEYQVASVEYQVASIKYQDDLQSPSALNLKPYTSIKAKSKDDLQNPYTLNPKPYTSIKAKSKDDLQNPYTLNPKPYTSIRAKSKDDLQSPYTLNPKPHTSIKPYTSIIMWDVLSGDFDPSLSPEKCLRNVLKHTENGSVVVFHDSLKAWDRLEFVLPKVLEAWRAEGFEFGVL